MLVDDLLLLLLLSLCLGHGGLLLMHAGPETSHVAGGWSSGRGGTNGAGINELGGRLLLGVEEGGLVVGRLKVHLGLASKVDKLVAGAQVGQVAVVEGVLVDVAVVHVDSQGVGNGSLWDARLLTIEIVVVGWPAEGGLRGGQRWRGVGDGSSDKLLLLTRAGDGWRVV